MIEGIRTLMTGSHALIAAGVIAAMAMAGVAKAAGAEAEEGVELAFLNGVYEDLDSTIAPIRQGPLVIQVSSPEHQMTVHGNRLIMRPEADGVAAAEITVDMEGYGKLVADLQSMGASSSFKDQVEVPRQSLTVAGRVRLRRTEEGFLLTVVELPAAAQLQIQSGVADQLVGVCDGLDKLPILALDCRGLAASLALVSVPLPGPGETYLIPDRRLTQADREFFQKMSESLEATAETKPTPKKE